MGVSCGRRSDRPFCGSDGARQGYPPPSALRGLDPRHALPEVRACIGASAEIAPYRFFAARMSRRFECAVFGAWRHHVVILHDRMTTGTSRVPDIWASVGTAPEINRHQTAEDYIGQNTSLPSMSSKHWAGVRPRYTVNQRSV